MEEYEHALKRGASIYSEIMGYGASSDAKSLVAPNIEGITLCMKKALKDADINSGDIEYINAHGTGTPTSDFAEATAINHIFDSHPYVSSTKSIHGHLLGASGALEFALCCLMIRNKVLIPQINIEQEDMDERIREMNLLCGKAQKYSGKYIMSNSFGFGGDNASLILGSA